MSVVKSVLCGEWSKRREVVYHTGAGDGTEEKSLKDLLNAILDRLTALEARGASEVCPDCKCRVGADGHTEPCSWPKPTPATVERFRTKIGEVVATFNDNLCKWMVRLPNSKSDVYLLDGQYRALVKHQTDLGVWEKQNG